MSIISEKFNAKVSALKSDFEVNRDVVHQGVKGGLNESELASLIKQVIPQKYKISKGIIENSKSEQSNETDFFIYDDEILPPYIKNDLAFVPVEAVKYVFEVKSKLNSTELKSSISKFEKYCAMGGRSPTVLFSFTSDFQGSELERYKKNEKKFFTYPSIMSLCVSNKCYYFKEITEHYLKDRISVKEFLKKTGNSIQVAKDAFSESLIDNKSLNQMTRSDFAFLIKQSIFFDNYINGINDKELTINGIKYSEIKFTIHKWIGLECSDNSIELSLLTGISNTLSKESFGNYLLHNRKSEAKVYAICYEDMWGNLSCQDFDKKGLSYNVDNVSFSFTSTNESNQIVFSVKK